jgi:Holliday junction resolvasome RuvABC endonuclease subunit
MNYIGIDPGEGGGIAVIEMLDDKAGSYVQDRVLSHVFTHKLKGATERDVWHMLAGVEPGFAIIEQVHSSPQMGVCSSFTFGKSYGFLRGILTATGIPFDEVSPQKWQKAMGCMTKGNKNVSKAKAQQLFPHLKVTHAIADALLLAEYARRERTLAAQ